MRKVGCFLKLFSLSQRFSVWVVSHFRLKMWPHETPWFTPLKMVQHLLMLTKEYKYKKIFLIANVGENFIGPDFTREHICQGLMRI